MPGLDLNAIKRRVEVLEKVGEGRAWPASHLTPLAKDALALVAEVERLQDLAGRLAGCIKSIETASMTDDGSVDWDSFDDVLIHSVQLADEVLGGVADG